jgi:hypothetical protein
MSRSNILKMAAGALGSLGLVLSAIENFHHLSILIEENYWATILIGWVLAVAAVWPDPFPRRVLGPHASYYDGRLKKLIRYKWVYAITLLFLAVSYYRHHLLTTIEKGPRPVIEPGRVGALTPSAVYGQTRPKNPKLLQFNLVPDKTSYVESSGSYKLPYGIIERLYSGECIEEFDTSEALSALGRYAKDHEKSSLLPFIKTEEQLKQLVRDHPKRADELIPKRGEWEKLSATDARAIRSWIRSCIGIFFPVFVVSIQNPFDQELLVTKARYNIYGIRKDRGEALAAPLIPSAVYVHKIVAKEGSQEIWLTPAGFNIPPKANGSFELQLWTDQPEVSATLTMDIEFITSAGMIKTSRFDVVFSALPK